MRIDLPLCSFKSCRYCFDGNCIKKSEYERCEYRMLSELRNSIGEGYDLNRLKELVKADRDGRCVVFPCKVGDTLYRIGYTTCKNGETHPDSYGCCGCYDECDMKKCVKEFIIPDSQWILSNYTNIAGGDWYFTREAVEVALKRMEGEEK